MCGSTEQGGSQGDCFRSQRPHGWPPYVWNSQVCDYLIKRGSTLKFSHVQHEARQVHCATPPRPDGCRGRGKARAFHVFRAH